MMRRMRDNAARQSYGANLDEEGQNEIAEYFHPTFPAAEVEPTHYEFSYLCEYVVENLVSELPISLKSFTGCRSPS